MARMVEGLLKLMRRRRVRALRDNARPLVFVHLPKTAGLSVRKTLLREVGDRPRFRIINPVEDLTALARMPAEERARLTLVEGHLYYGVHEVIGRPCRYFTMLRGPVERVLSWYSFVREYTPHHLHERVMRGGEGGGGMSLAQCLREAISVELDNHMVRTLAGQRHVHLPFGGVTREMLEEAKRNLGTFEAVGISERFEESLALFARVFGWKPSQAERVNVTRARVKAEELDEEALALVRGQNALDAEFYEYARAMFERQLAGR
jgi:hypothetical protein